MTFWILGVLLYLAIGWLVFRPSVREARTTFWLAVLIWPFAVLLWLGLVLVYGPSTDTEQEM